MTRKSQARASRGAFVCFTAAALFLTITNAKADGWCLNNGECGGDKLPFVVLIPMEPPIIYPTQTPSPAPLPVESQAPVVLPDPPKVLTEDQITKAKVNEGRLEAEQIQRAAETIAREAAAIAPPVAPSPEPIAEPIPTPEPIAETPQPIVPEVPPIPPVTVEPVQVAPIEVMVSPTDNPTPETTATTPPDLLPDTPEPPPAIEPKVIEITPAPAPEPAPAPATPPKTNGGEVILGTPQQPQVVGEDGVLTPPPPLPNSGDTLNPESITIAATFQGQPGGMTFNSPDIAEEVILVAVTLPAVLSALPGVGQTVQAVNKAFVALENVGADMAPLTRKKAKKILVTTIIGGIVIRRKP